MLAGGSEMLLEVPSLFLELYGLGTPTKVTVQLHGLLGKSSAPVHVVICCYQRGESGP